MQSRNAISRTGDRNVGTRAFRVARRTGSVLAMSERDGHPVGVPCWVETLQPDPRRALDFYGSLFGWTFSEPESGSAPAPFVARREGRAVAGVGPLPELGGPPAAIWNTRIRVRDAAAAVVRATETGGRRLLGPVESPAGRLAVLLDPTGAAFTVWEAGERGGAEVVNEPGAWMMSSLHTPDPERAGAFYAALLGWRAEPMAPGAPVFLFRLPGYVGGESGQPVPRDVVAVMTASGSADAGTVPPHWNVNLRVEDADATAARAAQLGGSVLMPPTDTPGFRSAVLLDPQGAAFSISRLVPAG